MLLAQGEWEVRRWTLFPSHQSAESNTTASKTDRRAAMHTIKRHTNLPEQLRMLYLMSMLLLNGANEWAVGMKNIGVQCGGCRVACACLNSTSKAFLGVGWGWLWCCTEWPVLIANILQKLDENIQDRYRLYKKNCNAALTWHWVMRCGVKTLRNVANSVIVEQMQDQNGQLC